jgi:hypothetical protein
MDRILFRYRSQHLDEEAIAFIRGVVARHYEKGRSYIARAICEAWSWRQPNGKLKEYAARDMLLRLEERGLICLPPRLRSKNNASVKAYDQVPLFTDTALAGSVSDYPLPSFHLVSAGSSYRWDSLVHHYHYLGHPKLVSEHLKYEVLIDGQIVACLGWASAAWKIKDRDVFIGWDEQVKRKHLHLVVNNVRFLILPWVHVKHLASKILAMGLKCVSGAWQQVYGHPVYLAETFVDTSRYAGTCYRASNWRYVGQTKGSAKRGNSFLYHGRPKAIYLYPLHRDFRRMLCHETG